MTIKKRLNWLCTRIFKTRFRRRLLQELTAHYLAGGFNGMPALTLALKIGIEWDLLRHHLPYLIEKELIGVLYGTDDVNTHILRVGFRTNESQIAGLETNDLFHTCIYPRPKHLASVVDAAAYKDRPYELCLALGKPQLAYRSFDLSVLEFYRNDPRYWYSNDDINGSISVKSEFDEDDKMPEGDRVLLQSFGFSYDKEFNRAVAVYFRYLADLSPQHQRLWQSKELAGDYQLHPDFYRTTIIGDWPERISIFQALACELFVINEMSRAMGRPALFREDFGEYGENRPKKLAFLVRPTLEEFNNFVLLLDKVLSDNINKDFFQHEVSYETEVAMGRDRVQIQPKGTLQILNDWIRKYFRPSDWSQWDESMHALREVRKSRQKPAHSLKEDAFDQQYIKQQRDMMVGAYSAVRTLRLILANHPRVKVANVEIPEWLVNGDIWDL